MCLAHGNLFFLTREQIHFSVSLNSPGVQHYMDSVFNGFSKTIASELAQTMPHFHERKLPFPRLLSLPPSITLMFFAFVHISTSAQVEFCFIVSMNTPGLRTALCSLWFWRAHLQPAIMALDYSLPDTFVILEVLVSACLHRLHDGRKSHDSCLSSVFK